MINAKIPETKERAQILLIPVSSFCLNKKYNIKDIIKLKNISYKIKMSSVFTSALIVGKK